jgi:uncharacterized protein YbaR (Trm112 family)/ribosomal protein S27AE
MKRGRPPRRKSLSGVACERPELTKMEASKCPKCGEEPNFLEHMEKWYCYECNSYVDQEEIEAEEEMVEEEVEEAEEMPAEPEEQKPEAPKAPTEILMCANCGQPLKWIEKYQRHYCYSCKKYAPVETPIESEPAPPVVAPKKEPSAKCCPECSTEMKFVQKYDEWYCYTCKKYPLHKAKAKPEAPKKESGSCCPKCKGKLRYIEKYKRHYCDACKAYAPKSGAAPAKKVCPTCKSELKYIQQYNEWYCFNCKKYPLRPGKPVLLL